jgi:hypothetical protein
MVNQAMSRNDTYAQIKAMTFVAAVLGIQTEGVVNNNAQQTTPNLILPNGAVRKGLPEFRTLTILEQKILDYNKRANQPTGPQTVHAPDPVSKS